ncbi:MAG: hypothetical protein IKX72_04715, partial [Oscillospiraceae bacterium]|nr:hypothetical protein [Oscillospiraceae bacterium]
NEPIPTGDDAVPALETAKEAASAGAETSAGINVPKTPKKSRKKKKAAQKRAKQEEERKAREEAQSGQ